MSMTKQEALSRLAIAPEKKARRNSGPYVVVLAVILFLIAGVAVMNMTKSAERKPIPLKAVTGAATNATEEAKLPGDAVLTVSGYVIPRERIEISPKFLGTVKWIGVKKGDTVKKGDVLVELEDDEYRARVLEAEGRVKVAQAALASAELEWKRQSNLVNSRVDSQKAMDDAQRVHDMAVGEVAMAEGQLALAKTYLGWCTIRAPIDGVVLEKLVNPNELVVPQSFGSSGGPSTAFLAMADLMDLQMEIDLNEADTPRVYLGQKCRVSPEAYPDKVYEGTVAEIAPEANRAKGTLQVKVQIAAPDRFLTPELTAKVDFLK